MHNFEISMCCTSSFILVYHTYKRDISHFLECFPLFGYPIGLPRCFTPDV